MIFQQMKLGKRVVPHVHVIWIGQTISKIILIIQCDIQGKRFISRSSKIN